MGINIPSYSGGLCFWTIICRLCSWRRRLKEKAALHEGLSDELAEKLQQPLGNLSEDGIELSGGQWQRLALSRTCYRDSEILILDEPTASLDPVAENELYANFIEMMKNRSCILISHRLAVARYVDRILVLQRGELIEDGDHESLMRKNGAYASMYYAQSHWYLPRKVSGQAAPVLPHPVKSNEKRAYHYSFLNFLLYIGKSYSMIWKACMIVYDYPIIQPPDHQGRITFSCGEPDFQTYDWCAKSRREE